MIFLLGVEKGAILGCNQGGMNSLINLSVNQLDIDGPAVQKGDQVERHFKSETYVTLDLSKKAGKIFWANTTIVLHCI